MLRSPTEQPVAPDAQLPSGDDAETLHEAARESIRTRLRRATLPLVIEAPQAVAEEAVAAADEVPVEGTPEVAPIPAVPMELPAPYEPEAEDESVDIHDAARKRIRRITQPIEVPVPTTTSASYAPDAEETQPQREVSSRARRTWYCVGFLVVLLGIAGVLNYRTIAASFNYQELTSQEVRQLAPELSGGYIVKHQEGNQFIGHLLRESGQTSRERAGILAEQLLDRLADRGVRKVLILDRENIPVAIKTRVK